MAYKYERQTGENVLLLAVHKREIPFFVIMVSEVGYEEK